MQLLRALLLTLLLFFGGGWARAEISLTPLRQVLTEQSPVTTYRVSNPSRRIIEGRVSWADLSATETGYKTATQEQRRAISAAPFLAVWPAFFRLEPGASTTISVAIRDSARLVPGERRSHLVVETGAVRTPLRKAGGTVGLDVGLGVSTPVLLRVGAGKAAARISDTKLLRTPEGLLEVQTYLEPTGKFSAYGSIIVALKQRGENEAPLLLKRIENVAVYIDTPRRRIIVPLGVKRLPPGILEIRYLGRAEFDGVDFATRSFEIAPPR